MPIFCIVLIVIVALILLYTLWCFIEPFILDLDRSVLKNSGEDRASYDDIRISALPLVPSDTAGNPDLRLFFFSDVHAEWCAVSAKRICNSIRKSHSLSPLDAVIFGGDITSRPRNISKGCAYLREISTCCKELGIPFYGVSGNHDYNQPDAPKAAGFISLDNTSVTLTSRKDGTQITLTGTPNSGRKNRVWQNRLPCEAKDPLILIAHDPEALLYLDPEARPDFMLSGHIHGGQMKLPFRLQFTALRRADRMPKLGVVQGVYNIMGTSVFVSRGLGCGVLPFRFLSVPEATVVEIHA